VPKRNKYVHKSKTHASQESTSSSYVLRRNNLGKVVATYVGNQSNIYVKRSLWVPKFLVADAQGPNVNWGPKRRN
jgi:cyanate permease